MKKVVVSLALVLMAFSAVATVVSGQTPPPPPPPLPTPAPPAPPGGFNSPTPTATATATATPTPIPLTLRVSLSKHSLAPGAKQKVTITTLPAAKVHVLVRFPDGSAKTKSGTANTSGRLTWTYSQPGSRITHSSRTGKVNVTATAGTVVKTSTKKYTIGFGAVDVTEQPRNVKRGKALTVWEHTTAGASLSVTLRFHGGTTQSLQGRAGSDGWWSARYVVPSNVGRGAAQAQGSAMVAGKRRYASSGFRVS